MKNISVSMDTDVSDTVVENQITFPESSKIGLTQGEEPLGNLLSRLL